MSAMQDAARRYAEAGYKLAAWERASGKGPREGEWGLHAFPPDKVTEQHNVGLNHALSRTAVLDVDDIPRSRQVFEFLGLDLDELIQSTMSWRGNPERVKLAFRAPETMREVKKLTVFLTADAEDAHTVLELRGAAPGKQAQDVLPPSIHPDTRQPYRFETPLRPRDALPPLPPALLRVWSDWQTFKPMLRRLLGDAKLPPEPLHRPEQARSGDGPSIIGAFNARFTVGEILTRNGYTQQGKRWLRPGSKTGVAGIVQFPDGAIYAHGGGILADEKPHDAFDLYRILEHCGDWTASVRTAAELLRMRWEARSGHDTSQRGQPGQPWPDPQPLPPELHPVQPFDLELLPDSLRPWIADVCERVQCPPDFVAVPVMVALGSLIGRKVRVRPKACDNWTVVPNVWGCIIGRPGTMKSPAVSEALQPLRRLEAQAREEHDAALADYEMQAELAALHKEAAKKKARDKISSGKGEVTADALRVDMPDAPTLRRYTAHLSSVQALGVLLKENPNGLLVERDELASLLSSLAQEEKAEDRGFYLTGADGVSGFTFDTITRGLNLRVPAVCLSILGTSQPGKIGRYLRQAQAGGEGDDGMMQRFGLMVWPDGSPEWRNVDRWPDSEARRRAAEVFERLEALSPDAVQAEQDEDCAFLRFAPDALEAFTEWRTAWEQRLRSGEWHPALESHFAKYRKTVPALALILHVAEGASGHVTLRATLRALAWAEYLESHALRCYGATLAGEIAAARRVLARIRMGELLDGFKAREVERKNWSELTDRDTLRVALGLLVAHGYLREIEVPSTAAGGRPTLAYLTHPELRDELA